MLLLIMSPDIVIHYDDIPLFIFFLLLSLMKKKELSFLIPFELSFLIPFYSEVKNEY